jgi:general secretion pathway protein E
MGAADSDAVSPPAVFLPDLRTLHAARALADKSDRNLMSALVELTRAEPRALLHAMAARLDLLVIETAGMLACVPVFESVPLHKAMKRHSVLLRDASGLLFGVVADPFDLDLQTWLESCAGRQLPLRLALQEDIDACLSKFEESTLASEGLGNKDTAPETDSRAGSVLSLVALNESSSPAVKLVNSLLYDALKAGASDIHIESTPSGFSVKFRIDGVLDHALTVGGVETAEHVVSRLKVLAELDISERRIPQDGSFMVKSGVRDIDLRLSIMPSIHGEDAVIRVLDKRAMVEAYGALTLDALGFDANSLAALRRMAREPYGMLLVTGPTGSGKTTTLYGALTEIHDGRSKIITIEDPVEYQLPGILQIPVNEKKGLTFARGLRSILRHDPDKIMVGEIRDHETAEIAVQSALTGHLVLTTVHANNVFDALGRFTHLGIDPYSFVSALNGIWAQRLVRINCPHCSIPYKPSEEEKQIFQLESVPSEGHVLMVGQGCGDCRGTGYKGRRAVAEVLILTDDIRELIVDKAPLRQVKALARQQGTRTLRESAFALARRGETTLAEVNRVTLHA